MRVTLRHPFIRQTTYAALPSGEEQIQDICRIFSLENTAQTAVIVDEVYNDPDANALLRNKEFKLDELNYLMKCMDGFEGLADTPSRAFKRLVTPTLQLSQCIPLM